MDSRIAYPKYIPNELIEAYPSMYLDKNAPQELQEAFYNREITSEFITSNPSYKEFIKNIDLELLYDRMFVNIKANIGTGYINLVSGIKQIFGCDDALDIMLLYEKYIKNNY